MRSSFFEFNVAISGLFTAKNGLQVTSHNIANAATVGYSRQVALQQASRPLATYNGKGMVGTGSEVYGVGQIRDFFLDQKYWTEKCVLGNYSVKRTQLSLTEATFNEVAGTGLMNVFTDFFSRLSDLTTTANDDTFRTNVLQSAQSLTQSINSIATSIQKQQSDINNEVSAMVDIINSLGEQISSLNRQIFKYEMDGSSANDLRDARARLVDELSIYCNVEVSELDYSNENVLNDKRFIVMINGYDFVSHFNVNTMEVVERKPEERKNPMDIDGLYDIRFKDGSLKFNIYHPNLKGELKGLIDVRDGNNGNNLWNGVSKDENGNDIHKVLTTSTYKGLPHYMNKLNELVRVFAKAMNEGKDKNGNVIPGVTGHIDGYNAYPDGGAKPNTGIYLYTDGTSGFSGGYNDINCLNFTINQDIMEDPSLLACSDKPTDESGESNNNVILNFAYVQSYKSLFKEGKLEDYIISITSEMAIDIEQAKRFESNYTDVITMVDNQRISVSGVDSSEESLNMIKYQQLYTAASKLVNVIDSIYDHMINRLGAF